MKKEYFSPEFELTKLDFSQAILANFGSTPEDDVNDEPVEG